MEVFIDRVIWLVLVFLAVVLLGAVLFLVGVSLPWVGVACLVVLAAGTVLAFLLD
jgi:hydrogenase/urease accessory protein HupE